MASADALPSLAIDGERSLGVRLGERYSLAWIRPVGSPRLAVGRLARAASLFAGLAGRPQSVRRAFSDSSPVRTEPAERWPVELPPSPYLSAWWRLAARERFDGTVPPRGLPRAVGRSMRSPAGEQTGPTGFTRRMGSAELPIRASPDVAAAGPMFRAPESRRAPRRAAPRPSESAGGETPSPPVRRTDVLRATVMAQRTHASAAALPSAPLRPAPSLTVRAGVAARRGEQSAGRALSSSAAGSVARVSAHPAPPPRLSDAFAAEASLARDRVSAPGPPPLGEVAQMARAQPAGNVASPGTAGPVGKAAAKPSATDTSAAAVEAAAGSSVIPGAGQRTARFGRPAVQAFDPGVVPSAPRASPPTAAERPKLGPAPASTQPGDALRLTVNTRLPLAAIGPPRPLRSGPGHHIRRSLAPSVEQTAGADTEPRPEGGSERSVHSMHEGPSSIAAAVSGTRLPTTLFRRRSAFPTVVVGPRRRVPPGEIAVDFVTRPTSPRWVVGLRHDGVATATTKQPPAPSAAKSSVGPRAWPGGLLRTSLVGPGAGPRPRASGRTSAPALGHVLHAPEPHIQISGTASARAPDRIGRATRPLERGWGGVRIHGDDPGAALAHPSRPSFSRVAGISAGRASSTRRPPHSPGRPAARRITESGPLGSTGLPQVTRSAARPLEMGDPTSAGRGDRSVHAPGFPLAAAVSVARLRSAVVPRQAAGAAARAGSRDRDRQGAGPAVDLATHPPPWGWLGPAGHGAVLTAATNQSALRGAVARGPGPGGRIAARPPGQFLRAVGQVERAADVAPTHGNIRAAALARPAPSLVTAVAGSPATRATMTEPSQQTTASSRRLPPGLPRDAGPVAHHLAAGTPTTRVGRASVVSPTVASVGARGGIDEVFARATGGLIRTLEPPAPALLGASTGADAVYSTHLPGIRRSREESPPGRFPAAVSTAPRPSELAWVPTNVPPGEAPAPPRAARRANRPAGGDRAVAFAGVAPTTAGRALAAPHLARGIVGRLGDDAAPIAARAGFERRALPSLAAGADGLQVGSIRLPSASRAVAPTVIWQKAERAERTGMSNDRVGAGHRSETSPPGSGDLLQRARALFSSAGVPPATSSPVPGPPSLGAAVMGRVGSRPPDPHHPQPGDPPIVLRRFAGPSVAGIPGGPPVDTPSGSAEQSRAVINAETIEWIIEAVEERVLEELERRGLRHNPGVF